LLGIDRLGTGELFILLADCPRAGGFDLVDLARSEVGELERTLELGQRRALRLAAAFELGRRVQRAEQPLRTPMHSAERVFRWIAPQLQGFQRETFQVLLLDGKHRLKRQEIVSIGTLTTSLVHPREVFRPAVREAAAAVICAHNHPSGDPHPSAEDLEVTRRLLDAGRTLGIPLLDHVILGAGRYVSLREHMGF
jgi:DNA repair protein RadC